MSSVFPLYCAGLSSYFVLQASTSKSILGGQNTSAKTGAALRRLSSGNGTKQASTGKILAKTLSKQRLHPGMMSSRDRATAHYGAVTGLRVTEDGMYLLSAGISFKEISGIYMVRTQIFVGQFFVDDLRLCSLSNLYY